jgi:hypothetical protein
MSTYNGWSNWETWKTNLEILDGMDAQDLGIEHYADGETISIDSAYEAGQIIQEYVGQWLEGQYTYQGFVGGIINDFLNSVNWTELAQGILEQWMIDNPMEIKEDEEE